jgi:hypothetical protein
VEIDIPTQGWESMGMDMRSVRMPQRVLTPEQAAKFAALRLEIETELAASSATRLRAAADKESSTCKFRRRHLGSLGGSSGARKRGAPGR